MDSLLLGLVGVVLLLGWIMLDGYCMMVLWLDLELGWKIYWCSLGDVGILLCFDW